MDQAAQLIIDGEIATINLSRAKTMNSYNKNMADSLLKHTETLSFNDEVKIVLLRGSGSVFMAGGDISFFAEHLQTMPNGIRDIIRTLANTINNIRQSKHIYLAAVHGAVAGAGMSLMLACDLVLASKNTIFTTAYNRLGTSPDGGLSYFLPKLVGDKIAMQLLLLSDRLDTSRMQQLGLINAICEQNQFENNIKEWLAKLIKLPISSSSFIKKLIYHSHTTNLEGQFEEEAKCFIASCQTKEFSEGVRAFIEKRAPNF